MIQSQRMEGSSPFLVTLFLGALAAFCGIQIGRSITQLRQHKWSSSLLTLATGIFIPSFVILIGDPRYTPDHITPPTWLLMGALLLLAIIAVAWLFPLLLEDLGRQNVVTIASGGLVMLIGIVYAIDNIQQKNWLSGIFGGGFVTLLGARLSFPGVRAILNEAFDKAPPENGSQNNS